MWRSTLGVFALFLFFMIWDFRSPVAQSVNGPQQHHSQAEDLSSDLPPKVDEGSRAVAVRTVAGNQRITSWQAAQLPNSRLGRAAQYGLLFLLT